jgi:osmotically-inducible protein OsmY
LDPNVQAHSVGIQVDGGIVTLTGTVNSERAAIAAERAAHRVSGVRAVANNLLVRTSDTYNDTDIAQAVVGTLALIPNVSRDPIEVGVRAGVVTLRGECTSTQKKVEAATSVRAIRGADKVVDKLSVAEKNISAGLVRAVIEAELMREAEIGAKQIHVTVNGADVRLAGAVRSRAEKKEAVSAVRRIEGVKLVDDEINVQP